MYGSLPYFGGRYTFPFRRGFRVVSPGFYTPCFSFFPIGVFPSTRAFASFFPPLNDDDRGALL